MKCKNCGHSLKRHWVMEDSHKTYCTWDCKCERFEPAEMIDAYPKTWDEEMIKAVEKMEEEEEQAE